MAISRQNIVIYQIRASLSSPCFPSLSILRSNPIKTFNPNNPLSLTRLTISSSSSSSSSASSSVARTVPPIELQDSSSSSSSSTSPNPNSSWTEFACKVSGEWDGHGADFTSHGKPIELPESVVPGAYREWDVKVFDWQTQCPTLAEPEPEPEKENTLLSYKVIRLLPTVGCEADAATVYSIDERNVGGVGTGVLAFGYHSAGNYVAVWPVGDKGVYKLLELEHCLIDPNNRESRVRIVQVVRADDSGLRLELIKVFCEQWYGPFRNGEQLGGCAIRDSGFASTAALEASELVKGVWQSCEAVAKFDSDNIAAGDIADGRTRKIIRDESDLIVLPRQLWCSLKEEEDGEFCGEVGWLLDRGSAISSRVVFSNDTKVKEIAIGYETAVKCV
ncbi:hypothetical protein Dimus_025915 [Dionaea muscipula]